MVIVSEDRSFLLSLMRKYKQMIIFLIKKIIIRCRPMLWNCTRVKIWRSNKTFCYPKIQSIPWFYGYPKTWQSVVLKRELAIKKYDINEIYGGPYWWISRQSPTKIYSPEMPVCFTPNVWFANIFLRKTFVLHQKLLR